MARVLVISFSDLARDPRVDRQIDFLRGAHEVVAAGFGPPAYGDVSFVDVSEKARSAPSEIGRRVLRLTRLVSRSARTVYWREDVNRNAFERLRHHRADLLIANDIWTLPLALRLAGSQPVLFDAHEFAPAERSDVLWWRLLIAPHVDRLLRLCLPRVAAVTTVAPALADCYARDYGVRPVVVTNAAREAPVEPTPVHEPVRVIHHGNADPQRALEVMIKTMDLLDGRFRLDLMLMPTHRRYYQKLIAMTREREHVRIIDPVPQGDIVRACNSYDIGLYALPPTSANTVYALPNKLFEFVQARLALVVGPSPEMARMVGAYDCGAVSQGYDAADLAAVLTRLDAGRIMELKWNSHRAAGELSAESNRALVLSLIEELLARRSRSNG